jgi:hypothetical protein
MSSRALNQWWHEGKIHPALVTPGGRVRSGRALWDIDDLILQLRPPRELPDADEGRSE